MYYKTQFGTSSAKTVERADGKKISHWKMKDKKKIMKQWNQHREGYIETSWFKENIKEGPYNTSWNLLMMLRLEQIKIARRISFGKKKVVITKGQQRKIKGTIF